MTLLSFNGEKISAQAGTWVYWLETGELVIRVVHEHIPTLSVSTGLKGQAIDGSTPKVLFILHDPINYV